MPEQTSPAVDTGIVAFIEARLDEREQPAAVEQAIWGSLRGELRDRITVGEVYAAVDAVQQLLIAEVAKDRAILALHQREDWLSGREVCVTCCDEDDSADLFIPVEYPCQTVRLLAATDADHPAFDPSWKPVAT